MNSATISLALGRPKRSVHELALFGGAPAFARRVHVGRPNIGDHANILRRFEDVLESRLLSNAGPNVRELEKRLAHMLGVKHVICTCNGTIALEIAIRAAGLTGEVIVPSFTFVATAHALQWLGITPVFCDVDPLTHNLDPARVRELVTPRTSGIVGVHVWGRPCDVAALEDIADQHGLQLLFDAAHALHCTHQGRWVGGFGHAEIFSFHATKFFNTLEGGAVATNDDDFARRVRLMKNFGFADYDRVIQIGINAKMNEICAAMGLAGLEEIQSFISINLRNYATYMEHLGVPGITLIQFPDGERHNYQYIVIEVDEAEFGLSRDELLVLLHAENVLARRYFYPGCHRMEPYGSCFPGAGRLLPHTEALSSRVMSLPTGTGIDREGVKAICELIAFCAEQPEEIRHRHAPFGGRRRAAIEATGARESVQ